MNAEEARVYSGLCQENSKRNGNVFTKQVLYGEDKQFKYCGN